MRITVNPPERFILTGKGFQATVNRKIGRWLTACCRDCHPAATGGIWPSDACCPQCTPNALHCDDCDGWGTAGQGWIDGACPECQPTPAVVGCPGAPVVEPMDSPAFLDALNGATLPGYRCTVERGRAGRCLVWIPTGEAGEDLPIYFGGREIYATPGWEGAPGISVYIHETDAFTDALADIGYQFTADPVESAHLYLAAMRGWFVADCPVETPTAPHCYYTEATRAYKRGGPFDPEFESNAFLWLVDITGSEVLAETAIAEEARHSSSSNVRAIVLANLLFG